MRSHPRPRIHFTPPQGFMNDPNGLVRFEGEWHLFYQHVPHGPDQHWGHAVSQNLIHWEHLPIALAPDPDLGRIWSGSAVADAANTSGLFPDGPGLVAVYTNDNKHSPPRGPQVQSIAFSTDRGRSWRFYAGNPVIPNPDKKNFRDPKVMWHEATQHWVMVLAAGDRILFYRSPNLREWTLNGAFGGEDAPVPGVWECPDLFELPVDGQPGASRWVLVVSIVDSASNSRTGYFLGRFDGIVFTPENPGDGILWADAGRDFYAAVTWSNVPASDGRCLWMGWMGNWRYAGKVPTAPWKGMMTLPRELTLRLRGGKIRLVQKPVTELEAALLPVCRYEDIETDGTLGEITLPDGCRAYAVSLTVDFPEATDELTLRFHNGPDQYTTLGFRPADNKLFLDRAHSGVTDFHPGFAERYEADVPLEDDTLTLFVLVDTQSVEVFVNDGAVVLTAAIFPLVEASVAAGVRLHTVGGPARIKSLCVRRIEPPVSGEGSLSDRRLPE